MPSLISVCVLGGRRLHWPPYGWWLYPSACDVTTARCPNAVSTVTSQTPMCARVKAEMNPQFYRHQVQLSLPSSVTRKRRQRTLLHWRTRPRPPKKRKRLGSGIESLKIGGREKGEKVWRKKTGQTPTYSPTTPTLCTTVLQQSTIAHIRLLNVPDAK